MTLPLRLTDHAAELMRLQQRYRAIAEEFGDVRDPQFQRELAMAKREFARAVEAFDRLRQLRDGLRATRDEQSQLY